MHFFARTNPSAPGLPVRWRQSPGRLSHDRFPISARTNPANACWTELRDEPESAARGGFRTNEFAPAARSNPSAGGRCTRTLLHERIPRSGTNEPTGPAQSATSPNQFGARGSLPVARARARPRACSNPSAPPRRSAEMHERIAESDMDEPAATCGRRRYGCGGCRARPPNRREPSAANGARLARKGRRGRHGMTDLPHPRHRALAEIGLLIDEAKAVCDRYRLEVDRLTTAGAGVRRAAVLLRLAEDRLDQLRRSRASWSATSQNCRARGSPARLASCRRSGMVPPDRIELSTSPLPRIGTSAAQRLTTVRHHRISLETKAFIG